MRRPHRPRSPVERPYGLINAFLDQPSPYPLPPEKPEPPMTLIPPKKPPYGGYGKYSPIARNFRNQIANEESGPGGDYSAFNAERGGIGALGRYQMRSGALFPAGYVDAQNQWTGKRGINSAEEFLNDPETQEWAFVDFMRAMEHKDLSAGFGFQNIGQGVTSAKGDFAITKGGLMAAAHGAGGPALKRYLEFLPNNGWHSDLQALPKTLKTSYQDMEDGLRTFETVTYDRPLR